MSSSRFTRPLLLFLFVTLLSTIPRPARAEIVHGFLTAHVDISIIGGLIHYNCGTAWDFSAQTTVRWDSAGADLTFGQVVNNLQIWRFSSLGGSGILRTSTPLEALALAPEGGYSEGHTIVVYGVYVIKTGGVGGHGESLFAKFRVHELRTPSMGGACCHLTIEFYVQLDHSRNLDQRVPVEQSTWGRVKALYQ